MVSIIIDKATKTIAGYELPLRNSGLLLLSEDEFWPDMKIYDEIKRKQEKVEKGYDEIIGKTETNLTRSSNGEAPLNNLICDAMVNAAQADFSFTNFGGIRANIKSGPITPRDLFKVLPFGNSLVVMRMSGEFLKKVIESKLSGNSHGLAIGGGQIEFDPERPDGNKIISFKIGEFPLYPKKIYRVVTTDYLAEGNSGMDLLLQVDDANIARPGILMREAVSQYIQENTPLNIKMDGRWQRINN
jgi:5'-nucleotidase/UDP-sugar diphosphatase